MIDGELDFRAVLLVPLEERVEGRAREERPCVVQEALEGGEVGLQGGREMGVVQEGVGEGFGGC